MMSLWKDDVLYNTWKTESAEEASPAFRCRVLPLGDYVGMIPESLLVLFVRRVHSE